MLHFAVERAGDLTAVQDFLIDNGVLAADRTTVLDLDKAQQLLQVKHYTVVVTQKSNALHLAARHGHEELSMWLVDTFPSLDLLATTNRRGRTPAFYAGYYGHLSLLKELLRKAGFIDDMYQLIPDKALQLKKHLGTSTLSALTGSIGFGHPDTALWLLSLLNFDDFYLNKQNMFQYGVLRNQFPTFEAIAKKCQILDCLGIAFNSKTVHNKVLPIDWLIYVRIASSAIPTPLIDSLVKAGVCIDGIRDALGGRLVSAEAAQTHIANLATAYSDEDTTLLPLSASMHGNSLLTQLIKSRAIDKINFRLAEGDAIPLPPQLEAVTSPVDAKAVVNEKQTLLLNCHLVFHAQRVLHALKEKSLDNALLQAHLRPIINLQSQWPDLDAIAYLPKLKELMFEIKAQIASAKHMESISAAWVLMAWPCLQAASSPLTAATQTSSESQVVADDTQVSSDSKEITDNTHELIEILLSHPSALTKALPLLARHPSTATYLSKLISMAFDTYILLESTPDEVVGHDVSKSSVTGPQFYSKEETTQALLELMTVLVQRMMQCFIKGATPLATIGPKETEEAVATFREWLDDHPQSGFLDILKTIFSHQKALDRFTPREQSLLAQPFNVESDAQCALLLKIVKPQDEDASATAEPLRKAVREAFVPGYETLPEELSAGAAAAGGAPGTKAKPRA